MQEFTFRTPRKTFLPNVKNAGEDRFLYPHVILWMANGHI